MDFKGGANRNRVSPSTDFRLKVYSNKTERKSAPIFRFIRFYGLGGKLGNKKVRSGIPTLSILDAMQPLQLKIILRLSWEKLVWNLGCHITEDLNVRQKRGVEIHYGTK